MKRTKYVLCEEDPNHSNKCSSLEGEVIFSELHDSTLTIKLEHVNVKKDIRIRGIHRINVGEYVRLFHDDESSNVIEGIAYEIIEGEDEVKYRYASRRHKFVDYEEEDVVQFRRISQG